jgi:hypothetical protein
MKEKTTLMLHPERDVD